MSGCVGDVREEWMREGMDGAEIQSRRRGEPWSEGLNVLLYSRHEIM